MNDIILARSLVEQIQQNLTDPKLKLAIQEAMDHPSSPMAEIYWDQSHNLDWQLKMLVEPSVMQGTRIPLYAGNYESAPVMYIDSLGSFTISYGDD